MVLMDGKRSDTIVDGDGDGDGQDVVVLAHKRPRKRTSKWIQGSEAFS